MKNSLLNRVIQGINQTDTRLFLLILFCCNFLSLHPNGDEEQYFAMAKQFMDPTWMPHSFALNEFAGTRLVFQIIAGTLLKFMSFEMLTLLGRLLLFVGFIFPLSRIIRRLGFSNVQAFFLLQVIYFSNQTFFADEWMFGGIEASSIAYLFILFSIDALLENRIGRTVLFTILATYIHVLIGGWFMLALVLYLAAFRKDWLGILKWSALYLAAIMPFALYLGREVLIGVEREINGINLDWVYVYFRHPHHLGIFVDSDYFTRKHLPGILVAGAWFVLCLSTFRRHDDKQIRILNQLNVIVFSILFVSLIIAWFDKTGVFLKYYPFRIAVLAMFFTVFQVGLILKKQALKPAYLQQLSIILFVVSMAPFIYQTMKTGYNIFLKEDVELEQMSSAMKASTPEKSRFVFLGFEYSEVELPFIRMAERDRLVMYKYIPAGGNKIYEWYSRIQDRLEVESNPSRIHWLAEKYHVDYVVSPAPIELTGLEPIFESSRYHVYRIELPGIMEGR